MSQDLLIVVNVFSLRVKELEERRAEKRTHSATSWLLSEFFFEERVFKGHLCPLCASGGGPEYSVRCLNENAS